MKQHEVAALFLRTADLLEFRGDNPFRIRAYRRAAQSLERFSGDLEAAVRTGAVRELAGVGEELAAKIAEYCASGRVAALERLHATVPRGVLELLEVPGLGPKTAKLLHDRLRITTLTALERALRAHRLRGLPGVQARKEANLLKGLAVLRRGRERMHLGIALPLAEELLAYLRGLPGVTRASSAGSLRRMRETIGDLDLLAASAAPARVIEAFVRAPFCRRRLAAGTTKASILTAGGLQVDLRVVTPESFGAALQYFTGSKEHNVRLRELAARRGLKVNEYGVFRTGRAAPIAGREEADVYRALGLPWIPPELREDHGELDAARTGRLPALIERADLRGDFHVHTTWSDGRDGLEEMVRAAKGLGYDYVAICDHSPSLRVAHGMSIPRLTQQLAAVRALNRRLRNFRILTGSEVDILPDGSMDYPDDVLAKLDFVVGSVHSAFTQGRAAITRRLTGAMRHPGVALIGHPTGRLMGQRDAYDVDLEEVCRAARETGTALELNASPQRMDLTDAAARRARETGVMLAISTDAHSAAQLEQVRFGVGQARRAWCEPRHLLNTLRLAPLLQWLGRKRRVRP